MGTVDLVQAYFLIVILRSVAALAMAIILFVFYMIFVTLADKYVNYKRSKKKGVDNK